MRDGYACWQTWRRLHAFRTVVATGDVLYHSPARRILQDVVTCIREGCTIDQAGFRRERTVDRCLKSSEEMARLLRASSGGCCTNALRSSDGAGSSLADLRYQVPRGSHPMDL